MNKVFIIIISVFILFGCSEKKEQKSTSDKANNASEAEVLKNAPVENIDGAFLLKYKFEKGN